MNSRTPTSATDPGPGTGAETTSFTLHGSGVSGGIAIGHAHLISTARLEVAHYAIKAGDIDDEIARFDAAVAQVRGELAGLKASIPSTSPAEMGAFLNLHLMILEDSSLSTVPRDLVRTRHCNAEWALVQQMDLLVGQFEEIEDQYLRERKNDVMQVVERVLMALIGHPGHAPAMRSDEKELIVVAHDLSPADMILFKQHQFAGFVTDLGGVTSHTAIVARSLNIPAIVGLHHARQLIRENELLIVDGVEGVLIVNPDKQVLSEYQLKKRQIDLGQQKLKRLRTTPAADMTRIIGKTASVALAPGALLVASQYSDAPRVPDGSVIVGATLKPGQYPVGLRDGDTVTVIETAPPGAAGAPIERGTARIVDVQQLKDAGSTIAVSLVVPAAASTAIANAGSAGRVTVVVVGVR